jgi:hypothetical protein
VRTNILRSVALALGIGTCSLAQAQYGGYAAPAFNNQGYPNQSGGFGGGYAQQPAALPSTVPVHPSLRQLPPTQGWTQPSFPASSPPYRTVANDGMAMGGAMPMAGAPQAMMGMDGGQVGSGQYVPQPVPMSGQAYGGAMPAGGQHVHEGGGSCSSCNVGQIYEEAAAAPWSSSAPLAGYGGYPNMNATVPVKNWFAGSSLLFLDYSQQADKSLLIRDAMPSDTMMRSSQVDPRSTIGFETFIGRYFACGKYAITGSYFFLNPEEEQATIVAPVIGDYRATLRNWDRLYIDQNNDMVADDYGVVADPADDHLYQVYDQAAAFRIRRNVSFQGFELNFVSFGIGGASRAGSLAGGCGTMGSCGTGSCGDCGPCVTSGCGGLGGPMIPSCNNRMQFQVSHGIRWFQFNDDFEFAASLLNNGYGTGNDDFYYNVDTKNDLLGYQFGSKISYCLTRRVNVYGGAKFGIYGNNADYHARFGTTGTVAQVGAFYPAAQGTRMEVNRNDTVLSTLGELDLGLGFRLTNCWTITGGYRLLGVTGVATSVGSFSNDPANITDGHLNYIDDSLVLQGGYVGVNYNW